MATYPSSLLVKADVINDVDVVDQNDHNILKGEIIALQTTIGTNPHGNRSNLAARINAIMSGSGGFVNLTAVPAETYVGKYWYRTDLETMQVVKSDNTVQSVGGALSNVIFYSGALSSTSTVNPGNEPTFLVSQAGYASTNPATPLLSYWVQTLSAGWSPMRSPVKWKKITGVTTLRLAAYHWNLDSGSADFSFGIGTTTAATGSITAGTSPINFSQLTIDVSGLNVGTIYDIKFYYRQIATANKAYLGEHVIFGE